MLDPQQGRVISREVHCLITRRKDPAVPVGIVEVLSTHSAANRCTLQWCQAEHTLPDLTAVPWITVSYPPRTTVATP